jgi:integrase
MPMARVEKRSWEYDLMFIKQAVPHFKGMSLIDITPEEVRKFRDQRAQDETRPGKLRAKGTIKREMNMLSRIFNYAIELDRLQVNPCRKVKTPTAPNPRTRIISQEEEGKILTLLRAEAPYMLPVVELALETGMRRGELLKFCPRHLDFEILRDLKGNVLRWGLINLPGRICKSGKPRSIPMSEKARNILLEATINRDPERPIFRGYGFSLNNVSHVFTGTCRRLGIEEATFHTLRHTFGTRLAQAGTHQSTIKDLLGHASLQQTDVYVHPDQEMKQRAIQALSELRVAEVVRIEKTGSD